MENKRVKTGEGSEAKPVDPAKKYLQMFNGDFQKKQNRMKSKKRLENKYKVN
jgi:hypothetical protein